MWDILCPSRRSVLRPPAILRVRRARIFENSLNPAHISYAKQRLSRARCFGVAVRDLQEVYNSDTCSGEGAADIPKKKNLKVDERRAVGDSSSNAATTVFCRRAATLKAAQTCSRPNPWTINREVLEAVQEPEGAGRSQPLLAQQTSRKPATERASTSTISASGTCQISQYPLHCSDNSGMVSWYPLVTLTIFSPSRRPDTS